MTKRIALKHVVLYYQNVQHKVTRYSQLTGVRLALQARPSYPPAIQGDNLLWTSPYEVQV